MRMTSSLVVHPASVLALILMAAPVLAHADPVVYKCVDKDGRVELTDVNKAGCKPLDLPGYFPAPASAPRPNPAAASAPAAAPRQGAERPPVGSPANFPRVDSYVQKQRDDDRRDILNDELRAEEKKLAELRREFNNGEPERQGNEKNYAKYQERVERLRGDIARSEKNVEALRREIGNIR